MLSIYKVGVKIRDHEFLLKINEIVNKILVVGIWFIFKTLHKTRYLIRINYDTLIVPVPKQKIQQFLQEKYLT